jgi:hypothetical protein
MAVSNSTDFSETVLEIITDALAELGVNADEEPLEAADQNRALRALNRMLKAWQADGVMAWTYAEGELATVQGQASYDFGAGGDFTIKPFEILDMRINRGGNDLPMYRLSREEYYALPNKTNQGYPTQFYYDRQRDSGALYLWPAPDATLGTLKFTYRRVIMDIDSGADDFDVPQEWTEALVFGLASRLIGPYAKAGSAESARVEQEAARTYMVVKGFDIGEGVGSIRVTPNRSRDYRE